MKASLFHRMDLWVRHLLPVGVTLLLMLMGVVPTHVPGFAGIAPLLPMMAVFYWAIYRPDLLPAWAAFLVGLLQDVLAGTPPGVSALVLLLVHGATASQRRFFLGGAFLAAWWGFGLIAGAGFALIWLLASAMAGQLLDPRAVSFQYLLTLSLYPPVSWTLARVQVAFLRQA